MNKKEETKAPVVWPTVATTRLEKNIETKMTQVVNNQKEIDEKKCNLIVFNLPEIEETADGKEEIQEDYRNVTDILSYLDHTYEPLDLRPENLTRLGPKRKGKDSGTRPIKVELCSSSIKTRALRYAYRLKDYTIPKIGISYDKTSQELQEDRTLKQQLVDKRKEDPLGDYIRYGKEIMKRTDAAIIKKNKQDEWTTRQNERATDGGNPDASD